MIKRTKIDADSSEILWILEEECAETIQAVSKIFRFGFDGCHPDIPNYTNREHLETEIGDLLCLIKIMCDKGMITESELARHAEYKLIKLKKFSNIKGI